MSSSLEHDVNIMGPQSVRMAVSIQSFINFLIACCLFGFRAQGLAVRADFIIYVLFYCESIPWRS